MESREWFKKMFLPAVQNLTKKHPVILFFDGHHSHLTLDLIECARQNNVHLICFPPHCTHIMQPLVFGPLKSCWRKVLQLATCAAIVTEEEFSDAFISTLGSFLFTPTSKKRFL